MGAGVGSMEGAVSLKIIGSCGSKKIFFLFCFFLYPKLLGDGFEELLRAWWEILGALGLLYGERVAVPVWHRYAQWRS